VTRVVDAVQTLHFTAFWSLGKSSSPIFRWRDHIKCYSYQEEIVSKDVFGEVVSAEMVVHLGMNI
jgi:hypothetical protein